MSKLVKLKVRDTIRFLSDYGALLLQLASKKSLSCFRPSRMMATPGASSSTLFPAPPDPELAPKTAPEKKSQKPQTLSADHVARRAENLERAMVVVDSKDSHGKEKAPPKKEEPEEEVLELKTPGFIRLFGHCEAESEDDHRHKQHGTTSSDESSEEDHAASSSAHHHHQPQHQIPVVHLRVPMKNEDDIRKVVAALQLRGVLEVACDLENQIVKVTGNVDPDRLLKKVKKVKRKSKLISYTDPVEMPPPPRPFHSHAPPPPPPPQHPRPYPFHPPAYEERFRPPPREPHGYQFSREAFYRPPPPPPPFYPGYVPRPPSSPPHYSSSGASFFHERSPPHRRCSTSPPRRRSYHYHDRPAPPPPPPPHGPPPMRYPGGPRHWGPGPAYDFYQPVPDRMRHMYH